MSYFAWVKEFGVIKYPLFLSAGQGKTYKKFELLFDIFSIISPLPSIHSIRGTPGRMLNLVREYTLMSFNPFYAASFVLFNVKEGLLLHIENIKGKLFQNKLFQQMFCGGKIILINIITSVWQTNVFIKFVLKFAIWDIIFWDKLYKANNTFAVINISNLFTHNTYGY